MLANWFEYFLKFSQEFHFAVGFHLQKLIFALHKLYLNFLTTVLKCFNNFLHFNYFVQYLISFHNFFQLHKKYNRNYIFSFFCYF